MPVIDDRGRLFGTINLIDLGALLFVALLLPLTYAAYLLFRTPAPRLIAVVPATVPYSRGVEQRVQVQGDHIRPFLRAKLNGLDAIAFALQTPQSAEIRFADAPPGTYDVVLFDESQEVARLPRALTIAPPPILLVGSFAPLPAAGPDLRPSLKFGDAAQPIELLAVAPPDAAGRRRATLRVTCRLSSEQRCLVGDVPLAGGTELTLAPAGKSEAVRFHVDELRADASWLPVRVRFMGLNESLDRTRVGDVDIHSDQPAQAPPSPVAGVTTGAILVSLGDRVKGQGSYTVTAVRPQGVVGDLSGYGVLNAAVSVDAQAAELLVPVDTNVTYRGLAIRPGNILAFDTAGYRLQALILSVSTP